MRVPLPLKIKNGQVEANNGLEVGTLVVANRGLVAGQWCWLE